MSRRLLPTATQGFVADRRIAFVLDASALLAMVQDEPGGAMVRDVLENSVISTVNWSEVVQKASQHGVDVRGLRQDFEALGLLLVPFSAIEAETAAAWAAATRGFGLSMADRACLALASRLGAPALTTDRAWAEVKLGVEIELLR